MKYRLIVSDYDDTLSRHDGTVSEYTKKVIKNYRQQGGTFVISTGRTHNEVLKHCFLQLELIENLPVISCQGAIICMAFSNEILNYIPIKKSIAVSVLRFLEANDFHLHVCFGQKSTAVSNYDGKGKANLKRNKTIVSECLLNSHEDCTRIIIIGEPERIENVKGELQRKYSNDLNIDNTWDDFLEIYSNNAGKGKAIERISKILNIPREEIMAFGDSNNDAGMIEYAGMGIAVSNGSQKAKEAADYITLSSEEDGVAYAIEKFTL